MHDHLESNGDDLSGLLEQVSLGLSAFIDGLDYEPVDGRDQAREIVELIAERPGEGPGDFGKLTTWAFAGGRRGGGDGRSPVLRLRPRRWAHQLCRRRADGTRPQPLHRNR